MKKRLEYFYTVILGKGFRPKSAYFKKILLSYYFIILTNYVSAIIPRVNVYNSIT